MLVRRVDPRRVTHRDPADGHRGVWRQDRVDVDDTVDPHLAAGPDDAAREQGSAGGQETAVTDADPVEVSVWSDEYVVSDGRRMPGAAAYHGVLHHDTAGADLDLAIFGGEHGTEQDARVRPDPHRTAEDRRGRHVGAGMDVWGVAPMLNQHRHSLPGAARRRGVCGFNAGCIDLRLPACRCEMVCLNIQ